MNGSSILSHQPAYWRITYQHSPTGGQYDVSKPHLLPNPLSEQAASNKGNVYGVSENGEFVYGAVNNKNNRRVLCSWRTSDKVAFYDETINGVYYDSVGKYLCGFEHQNSENHGVIWKASKEKVTKVYEAADSQFTISYLFSIAPDGSFAAGTCIPTTDPSKSQGFAHYSDSGHNVLLPFPDTNHLVTDLTDYSDYKNRKVIVGASGLSKATLTPLLWEIYRKSHCQYVVQLHQPPLPNGFSYGLLNDIEHYHGQNTIFTGFCSKTPIPNQIIKNEARGFVYIDESPIDLTHRFSELNLINENESILDARVLRSGLDRLTGIGYDAETGRGFGWILMLRRGNIVDLLRP
ncbi:MAG: hypothetical protein R3C11_06230 [Planctomycetaceae bacterium]